MSAPNPAKRDVLAWHYERNGIFAVKSAYRLAYNLKNGEGSIPKSSAAADGSRKPWKLIWNAPIPNKVKIFGWRTACDQWRFYN